MNYSTLLLRTRLLHGFLMFLICNILQAQSIGEMNIGIPKGTETAESVFKNPPAKYRPIPFWFLNGKLNKDTIDKQIEDAAKAGFGGVSPLPLTADFGFGGAYKFPGLEPEYFSDEYFIQYKNILEKEKELGLQHILYDDINFPSGIAGGKMREKFPQDIRKILYKTDTIVSGKSILKMKLPEGKMMAAVAKEMATQKRINLETYIKDNQLTWKAPSEGEWKVMLFSARIHPSEGVSGNMDVVDYLDPEAVDKFIAIGYDPYTRHIKSYYGNTLSQLFFDDVGFYTGNDEGDRTWTYLFNEKFKELTGRDPAVYYPAMWEDIGSETEAARVAFFNTRAELLSEGFLRKVSEWGKRNNIKISGHSPDNYNVQPVHVSGDIFKYYRHQDIPTVDFIFNYGRGRDGFKLISSAANIYDRPIVAAEVFGALRTFDNDMLYRGSMELFVRGINQLIPHGMWYDYRASSIRILPLVSPYNKDIAIELPHYNSWAARSSFLLQGGRIVTDIAVIYPIASLQSSYWFGMVKNWKGDPTDIKVPSEIDYMRIGNLLTNNIHIDYNFIHPEILESDKYEIKEGVLELNNKTNSQKYSLLIFPGGKVVSVGTLEKLKEYYLSGGKIIATSMLPSKSAEFGEDLKVVSLVKELFGVDPTIQMPSEKTEIRINSNGGRIVFIPSSDQKSLMEAIGMMKFEPDVIFSENIQPEEGKGSISYIHRIKDGSNIYFFANSSDKKIETLVKLRGKLVPEIWDPHTGNIIPAQNIQYQKINGLDYTSIQLKLDQIRTVFIIAKL